MKEVYVFITDFYANGLVRPSSVMGAPDRIISTGPTVARMFLLTPELCHCTSSPSIAVSSLLPLATPSSLP